MVIGLAFLLCLATVPLAGGRLGALGDLRFRARGILYAAIVAQVLIISVLPQGSATVHDGVHLGTYVAVAAFVVANRRIPWVWLVALGGALNFAAIAANGGVMPAAPRALRAWSSTRPSSRTRALSRTRTSSSSATSSGSRARGP